MQAELIESREIAPGVRHFEFEALGVRAAGIRAGAVHILY